MDEPTAFLEQAAEERGVSVPALLRQLLHVGTIASDPRFQQLFATASESSQELFAALDNRLRLANPGLHYVFRSEYLGYRREDNGSVQSSSERSQVFVSVVPRKRGLLLVLPVDPEKYKDLPSVEVVTGRGHHGLGDVAVKVGDRNQLGAFFEAFDAWIRPLP